MLRVEAAAERHSLEALGHGERSSLAHVGAWVRRALAYREHYDAPNHGHLDPAEHTQRHCADERVRVREVLLERVDGEQC